MLAAEALDHLKSQTRFTPLGEPAGNLTIGRGMVDGRTVQVAIIENRIASGSLGVRESEALASLFNVVAAEKTSLVMYLDSAGARVSEGLPALGAFRKMYRAALAMTASGAPLSAICGVNCFGGASMLASLAGTRHFSENTRFAMSGPAILAQNAGAPALDDMFQALAQVAIGAEARAKLADGNMLAGTAARWGAEPAAPNPMVRHALLESRLARLQRSKPAVAGERIERKDLAKLFPGGHSLFERDGIVSGEAVYHGAPVQVLGMVNRRPLGAVAAWALADAVWRMQVSPPPALHILIDSESHAATLDEERIMLSAYLANLALALFALEQTGVRIEVTVLGKLGGGVYVALAAPATQVNLLYGMQIQLLPGSAIASILGAGNTDKFEFADYHQARVADQELKLGLVP